MSDPSASPPPGAEIGRVAALWRYPVKSMAAEPLEAVDVAWHGFVGDRRWAFVRDEQASNGFPWLTLRENPDLGKYHPAYIDLENPNLSAVTVRTPAGQELPLLDPALAAELGGKARVMKLYRGAFDVMPLSLITTRAISEIAAQLGRAELDVQRFRPNLLIEPVGDAPSPEDAWVGCVLRIGGMRMRVDQRDKRCVVVNVDPATGERDPAVLRAIARDREPYFGVYGSTVEPGRVSVGDAVVVESRVA